MTILRFIRAESKLTKPLASNWLEKTPWTIFLVRAAMRIMLPEKRKNPLRNLKSKMLFQNFLKKLPLMNQLPRSQSKSLSWSKSRRLLKRPRRKPPQRRNNRKPLKRSKPQRPNKLIHTHHNKPRVNQRPRKRQLRPLTRPRRSLRLPLNPRSNRRLLLRCKTRKKNLLKRRPPLRER
jgi:hypothetical protein